jgi:hypothetical protein
MSQRVSTSEPVFGRKGNGKCPHRWHMNVVRRSPITFRHLGRRMSSPQEVVKGNHYVIIIYIALEQRFPIHIS